MLACFRSPSALRLPLPATTRSLSRSSVRNMRVVPVPVRSNNYAYLIVDEPSQKAFAVDAYDVDKVSSAVKKEGVTIIGGITTHHHEDHSGGNKEYTSKYPNLPMYGGSAAIPALTNEVKDKDQFQIGDNISVTCLATPCHTQDSICFYITDTKQPSQKGVFTGDTLFQAGCGRFFEGNGEQMLKALNYLQTLPEDTLVYNGHEYTKSSVAFALSVDPDNEDLKRLRQLKSENEITTGKTTIGDEKKFNPFMRLTSGPISKATGETDEVKAMEKLRQMKNDFKE